MLTNKPYFKVNFNFSGCNYDLRMNDVPLITDDQGGAVISTIPVNEWMFSGKNILSLHITPSPEAKALLKNGNTCEAKATLQVDSKNQKDVPITTIDYISNPLDFSTQDMAATKSSATGHFDSNNLFREDKEGDVNVGPIEIIKDGQGIIVSRTIELNTPFPKWKWLTSDEIADNDKTKKELVVQYRKIWDSLHNKKEQSLSPLFKERTKELSEAYYTNEHKMDIIPDLEDAINDPALIQGGNIPDNKYAHFHIFANGKLADITTGIGSAIFFNYKDNSGSRNFSIIFRKEGDKWIITR